MKVLDYILTVQKITLVGSFVSIIGVMLLLFTVNPMNSLWWIGLFLFLLLIFLSSFFILMSFFWSFTIQKVMLGEKQVDFLIARSVLTSLLVIFYLITLLTNSNNLYINIFLLVFFISYLIYTYQLD